MFIGHCLTSVIIILIVKSSWGIDFMPCTERVDAAAMALARLIIDQHVPPGYRLVEYYPATQTGRHPHRWICTYERIDNVYRQDCQYLTEVRGEFRRHCPAGCEISQILVSESPIRRFISVEVLVNCRCEKIPRRRRRYASNDCSPFTFQPEKTTCTGIPRGTP